MKIYKTIGNFCDENTYFLVLDGKCLVVDCGVPSEKALSVMNSLNVSPVGVLVTHGHADHVLGVAGLQKSGIKVYGAAEESDVVNSHANLAIALGTACERFDFDVCMADGEQLDIDGFRVTCLHTPGHTKGSVCYLVNGVLFSGDTLFCASYGRCDFPTGNAIDLANSILEVCFSLPEKTPVFCGHSDNFALKSVMDGVYEAEADTTIGFEEAHNPVRELI